MKRIDKYGLEGCRDKYIFGERYANAEHPIIEFVDYCNEEIKIEPRIATIKTKEDYKKIYAEYMNSIVKYNADHIFSPKNICEDSWLEFLFEEVEE